MQEHLLQLVMIGRVYEAPFKSYGQDQTCFFNIPVCVDQKSGVPARITVTCKMDNAHQFMDFTPKIDDIIGVKSDMVMTENNIKNGPLVPQGILSNPEKHKVRKIDV
jgi:hypothetical protein